MRRRNYRLKDNHTYSASIMSGTKLLEKGSFLHPIKVDYVPRHILDEWKYFNKSVETFCYTAHGIAPVPDELIEAY